MIGLIKALKPAEVNTSPDSGNHFQLIDNGDESAFLHGYIFLDKLKEKLEQNKNRDLTEINFSGNGYCTDAVLKLILDTLPTKNFKELHSVNLTGCSLITDAGIGWLTQIIQHSQKLGSVTLDACTGVTECGLMGLLSLMQKSPFNLSAMATSTCLQLHAVDTRGSPAQLDSLTEKHEKMDWGNVYVVPHPSLSLSLSHYLNTKAVQPRPSSLHLVQNWRVKDSTLSITEVAPNSPFFDYLVGKNPVQVIIPFDASMELKAAKEYVISTISRILSKETINPPHVAPKHRPAHTEQFMDPWRVTRTILSSDGVLTNSSVSERQIGCYVSRQPLSRTNNYFEVEVLVGAGMEREAGMVIGIMHDVLFRSRSPMDSNETDGGVVDGVTMTAGDVIRFGIEGEWDSEYVPREGAKYFILKNGEKMPSGSLNKEPHVGMYPLVALVAKNLQVSVRMLNYPSPPEPLQREWELEKKTLEPGFTSNVLYDENGVVTYQDSYNSIGAVGLFLPATPISKSNCVCSIEILDTGAKGTITLGVGLESFKTGNQPGWVSHSIGFHGDDGKVFNSSASKNPQHPTGAWQKGDIITVTVSGFQGERPAGGETITVNFQHNNKEVETSQLAIPNDLNEPVVFIMGMHSKGEKARLLNFRNTFMTQSASPNKLTMGRSNFMNIYDDGKLAFRKFDSRDRFGTFVSKSPISKHLPYFEFKILSLNDRKHVGIGLCPMEYPNGEMIGWYQGSIAYHGDNGAIYLSSGSTQSPPETKHVFEVGDVIGCGIEVEKVKFQANGTLEPQQDVPVYFCRNGQRTHSVTFQYLSNGFFPCVSLHYEGDAVQLLNYDPCASHYLTALGTRENTQEVKEEKKEENAVVEGCRFLVVGVSDSKDDPQGRVTLLSQQLNLDHDLKAKVAIDSELKDLAGHLDELDLQGQQNYARLSSTLECLQRLTRTPDRVSFHALHLSSGKGYEDLLGAVAKNQKQDEAMHPKVYNALPSMKEGFGKLLKNLSERKAIPVEDMASMDIPFLQYADTALTLSHHLHQQGQVVVFPTESSTLVLDRGFLNSLSDFLAKKPSETLQNKAVLSGEATPVWSKSDIVKCTGETWTPGADADLQTPMPDLFCLVEEVLTALGMVHVPCLRTLLPEPVSVFSTLDCLAPTPRAPADFLRESAADLMVMKRRYDLPCSQAASVLPLALKAMAELSRPVILAPTGGVFQSGAVTSVICRTQPGDLVTGDSFTVQSHCFLPEQDEGIFSGETIKNVEEYTWNVFCLMCDLVDFVLQRQGIVPILHIQHLPGLVNLSVGCRHDWSSAETRYPQSLCTLCGQCCEHGRLCKWVGVPGGYLNSCRCHSTITGCSDCGICQACASRLWSIRSTLRPCGDLTSKNKPGYQSCLPFLSSTYNEVECIGFSRAMAVCLKQYEGFRASETSEQMIQVFPGRPVILANKDELKSYRTDHPAELQCLYGDRVTVRLHDIKGARATEETGQTLKELEIKPVYFTLFCREARVCHETGIVCYDSKNPSVPVAQFTGARALSADCNKFSVEILNPGRSRTIAIGLVHRRYGPNRQPGWDTSSIGYHADDGGIFMASGWPGKRVAAYQQGDVVTCEFKDDEQVVCFYKNGELVFKTPNRVRIPAGGFYPCVAMHSYGEAVLLHEKDPWLPSTTGDVLSSPAAFPTYKYGNLWISPGQWLVVSSRKDLGLIGWLLLHNPSKDLIGYQIQPDVQLLGNGAAMGPLEPGKSVCLELVLSPDYLSASRRPSIAVRWMILEKGRKYTVEELGGMFQVAPPETLTSHKLMVKGQTQEKDAKQELVPVDDKDTDPPKDSYILEVLKNGSSVGRYWLKRGYYHCAVEEFSNAAVAGSITDFLLRYPKFPTCDLPRCFQRGMRIIGKVTKDMYAECIITSVECDGKFLTLEYSPKDGETNQALCMDADSPDIRLKEVPMIAREKVEPQKKKEEETAAKDGNQDQGDGNAPETQTKETKTEMTADIDILGYVPRGHTMYSKRAYVYPPPHLLTEASRATLEAVDANYRLNSLASMNRCATLPTRHTVQELQMTRLSQTLRQWAAGLGKDGALDQAFAFLPHKLDYAQVCYPCTPDIFTQVDVHRLCLFMDRPTVTDDSVDMDVPVHFANVPGIKPSSPIPQDLIYGSVGSGWTYTALAARKLQIPLHDKFISPTKPELSRRQLEILLGWLLRMYASLCHIFAEQVGSLQYQVPFPNGTSLIQDAIMHGDTSVQMGKSAGMDASTLIKQLSGNTVVCKAHLSCHNSSSWPDGGRELAAAMMQPYQSNVLSLACDAPNLVTVAKDFFQALTHLQVFELKDFESLKALPEGLSYGYFLEVIILDTGSLTQLPEDIFMGHALKRVICRNMPISKLPSQWPKSSRLVDLELSGLLITSITPELAALRELERLDLSNNPITELPSELKYLTKLRTLNVNGMPWLTMDLSHVELTMEQFSTWFAEHPYMQNFLSKEKIQKLFMDFDHNRNGTLDAREVAGLNVQVFKKVPRLGSHNDGMVPDVIFELTSLEELSLNFQGIRAMPSKISKLKNLATLSLQYNPSLVSLPGKLGHLPNIKSIVLTSCPNLRTPPHEVLGRGFDSVKAYLKRLAGGYTECRRTKLMLVGLGGAGKTSLLRALMSSNKRTEGTKGEDITDGIVIQPWTAKSKDGVEVTYSSWDFAGQTLYYNTHQFFLSKRAIYLLLWSTRQGFEHAGLDFWLSSIASHAPKTPIFVVGTRIDEVPKAEVPVSELKKRYPQIAGFHFVSCLEGTGIKELEEDMLSVTLAQKNMGEKIPQVWLNLEDKILKARNETSILQWSVIKDYGMEVGIYDEKDIKEAIQFLHELGTVQYFDNDFLRDQVVINPQWIVNVMSCVVSVKESCIQSTQGQFKHEDIPKVWGAYPRDLHKWLLQLTEEFDLTFPLPQSPVNIVPCLLPQEVPENLKWPSVDTKKGFRETKVLYRFAYLPAGLFNRAQVRLFQFSSGSLIWKRGSMLEKNAHMALIKQISDNELEVRVQGPRPENIVFLVHEIFESLIEESFHGVLYDIFIPCPDCVSKEGTLDPAMFDRTLVVSAQNHRAPFLQCRKFFHTISMTQLLEIMPGDADQDFDAHLQRSIVMLKELNSAQALDVVILYSPLDAATPRENNKKVQPVWVRDDLQNAGFSCWFCEDMRNVDMNEMIVVLKECKVVVALLSDHFERDEKCRDTLLYAKERLQKGYVIVSVGESLAWQNTDLGMQIGKQELMVMVSNKQRYESRKEELVRYVKEHVKSADNDQSDLPAVFISYCWSNSHDAIKRGSKEKEGALGWEGGDPRQLKKELENRGIKCWLDVEQAKAGKGLFENITSGMCTCQVLVVCISDEYVNSSNCMMEMRFGVLNLNMPLVVAVVGTGKEWKRSEAGILMHRSGASKVYFQQPNETGHNVLASFVKDSIPSGMDVKSKEKVLKSQLEHMRGKSKHDTSNIAVSYQEEYELMQRKFMRHITSFISTQETIPMPRLIIFDFDQADTKGTKTSSEAQEARPTTGRPGLRPKTASRSTRHHMQTGLDDEDSWEDDKISAKVLCEYEQGWHLVDGSLLVRPPDDWLERLKHFAPYLARMYVVLKQSKVQLNCFSGSKGTSFQKWIDKQSTEEEFLESYKTFREFLTELDDIDNLFNLLDRCHLPSGKVYWLCPEHQKGPRITKLSKDVRTQKSQRRVVTEQDMLMKEIMEIEQQTSKPVSSSVSLFSSKKKAPSKTKAKEEPKLAEKAPERTAPQEMSAKTSTPQPAVEKSTAAEAAAGASTSHRPLPGERAMNKKRGQRNSAHSAASVGSNASATSTASATPATSATSTTSDASRKARAATDAVRVSNAAANKSKACTIC